MKFWLFVVAGLSATWVTEWADPSVPEDLSLMIAFLTMTSMSLFYGFWAFIFGMGRKKRRNQDTLPTRYMLNFTALAGVIFAIGFSTISGYAGAIIAICHLSLIA